MSDNSSVGRTPPKGGTFDVDEAREREAKKKIREKVQETVEDLGKVIRKKYGPPGTP